MCIYYPLSNFKCDCVGKHQRRGRKMLDVISMIRIVITIIIILSEVDYYNTQFDKCLVSL